MKDLKAEQGSISMSDEFANYMKLQRKIDKLVDQVKKMGKLKLVFELVSIYEKKYENKRFAQVTKWSVNYLLNYYTTEVVRCII